MEVNVVFMETCETAFQVLESGLIVKQGDAYAYAVLLASGAVQRDGSHAISQ